MSIGIDAPSFLRDRMYLIDKEGNITITNDLDAWAASIADADSRRVAFDTIGSWSISTVFLGYPHVGGMFETMAWSPTESFRVLDRYKTYDEAKAGHNRAVAELLDQYTPPH